MRTEAAGISGDSSAQARRERTVGGKAVELARTASEVIAADASEARLGRLEATIARLHLDHGGD
ncbi:MAG: hypothetical protein ACKOFO_01860, partial [Gemmatimonadota bacterium]